MVMFASAIPNGTLGFVTTSCTAKVSFFSNPSLAVIMISVHCTAPLVELAGITIVEDARV